MSSTSSSTSSATVRPEAIEAGIVIGIVSGIVSRFVVARAWRSPCTPCPSWVHGARGADHLGVWPCSASWPARTSPRLHRPGRPRAGADSVVGVVMASGSGSACSSSRSPRVSRRRPSRSCSGRSQGSAGRRAAPRWGSARSVAALPSCIGASCSPRRPRSPRPWRARAPLRGRLPSDHGRGRRQGRAGVRRAAHPDAAHHTRATAEQLTAAPGRATVLSVGIALLSGLAFILLSLRRTCP